MRSALFGLVLLLLPSSVSPAETPGDAALPPAGCVRLIREARIELSYGRVEEARERLWRALDDYPRELAPLLALNAFHAKHPLADEEISRYRGMLLQKLLDPAYPIPPSLLRQLVQDRDASATDLEVAVQAIEVRLEAAMDARLLDALALVQLRLDRTEEARATLDRLLELAPQPNVLWRCIRMDLEAEKWESALAVLERALAEHGEDAVARALRLDLLAKTGRIEELFEAVRDVERDVLPHSTVPSLIEGAWELRDRGEDDKAELLFRAALEIDPESEVANGAILYLYATPEERAEHAAAVQSHWEGEENPDELVREGAARLASGDAASAYELLARAAELLPKDELAWLNLGLAASQLERWDEAATALERATAINPKRVETLVSLGTALTQLERYEEAVAVLQKVVADHPDLMNPYYYLYVCHREMGKDAEAMKALAKYKELRGEE